MGFDIRLPIGLMFGVFGLLVAGYGVATGGDEMYAIHSLGININLWWGVVMVAFAAVMLLLARRSARALGSAIRHAEGHDGDRVENRKAR
jgi:hypothetical protein